MWSHKERNDKEQKSGAIARIGSMMVCQKKKNKTSGVIARIAMVDTFFFFDFLWSQKLLIFEVRKKNGCHSQKSGAIARKVVP